MTAYQRKPEKAVATCKVPGCGWERIYWASPGVLLNVKGRAEIALAVHTIRKHPHEAKKFKKPPRRAVEVR